RPRRCLAESGSSLRPKDAEGAEADGRAGRPTQGSTEKCLKSDIRVSIAPPPPHFCVGGKTNYQEDATSKRWRRRGRGCVAALLSIAVPIIRLLRASHH